MADPKYNAIPAEAGHTSADHQFAFSDKTIRLAFIRKVYSILTAQLVVTGFFIFLFVASERSIEFVAENPGLLPIAFITTLVCLVVLVCCESVARTTPTNFIFLFIFTIAEGFLLGVVSAQFKVNEVLLAVGITALICFSLTAFAFQTKIDFTVCHGVLFVLLIVLFCAGLILSFVPSITPIRLLYSCAGVLIFSLYLIYDTQMMVGGNHKYALSPEDYVFAALSIYLDIINIFIFILRIIGEVNK